MELLKWLFSIVGTAVAAVLTILSSWLILAVRVTIIATIVSIAVMGVIQYAAGTFYDGSLRSYEYYSNIEGKVGELDGKAEAFLVLFEVKDIRRATSIQTRAFLTPDQVLKLEKLPTLTFIKTAPGCYHIKELQVITNRL